MKKKIIVLLAVAAMSMSFTGCGDSGKSATTEKATTEWVTTVSTATESTTTESTDTSDTQLAAERGTVTDGVFTNSTFKISFPIQSDYTVYTDAEIATIMGLGQTLIEDNGLISVETYEDALSGAIYDFMMTFSDMQSNVSVSYINLAKAGIGADISIDLYVQSTTSQLSQMTSPKYTINETTTETYGGQEYTCINVDTDHGFSQKILMRKESSYMVLITLTYIDSTPELASDFLNSFITVE